jgi:membrane fusion protein (multidrug efflux system)
MEAESKDTATTVRRKRGAKKAYLILAVVAVVVGGAWLVHRQLTAGKQETDDAQVEADVVPLAARVGGVIKSLGKDVRDNVLVTENQILFEIDPTDLDVEVARTEAELEAANAQALAAKTQVEIVTSSSTGGLSSAKAAVQGASASVRSADDAVRAAQAGVARAKAELANADTELASAQALFAKEAITKRELEHQQQVHAVARANLDAANAQLASAQSARGMASSRVAEAEGHVTATGSVNQQVAAAQAAEALADARVKAATVARDKARIQRSYATVRAPTAGLISKLGAHPGQTVMAGQALLMLVPTETYVVANFKENQVEKMKAGNPVDIEIDAFPGTTFKGKIDTVSPATGARFSMIPPDNATGNFVKVVQRVPVKIVWTEVPTVPVRPGLSADVTVHVE